MIIKVPVYLVLENFSNQELLPEVVEEYNLKFTRILQQNLESIRLSPGLRKLISKDAFVSIIARKKALETLRTSK
jgi:hypothetical protein